MTYFGSNNKEKKKDGDYYASVGYQYSDSITKTSYFGTNKKLVRCEEGYAILKILYNKNHEIVEERYYDERELPTLIETIYGNGPHCIKHSYDEWGNKTEEIYLDTQDRPFLYWDGNNYCARWKDEYLGDSDKKTRYYYDVNGNLIGVL